MSIGDTLNLHSLGDEELRALLERVQHEMETRLLKQKADAKRQIMELANRYGIEVEIKSDTGKSRPEKTIRFRDPDNEFNTWSGRGRKPQWLQEKLAGGASIEAFKVG